MATVLKRISTFFFFFLKEPTPKMIISVIQFDGILGSCQRGRSVVNFSDKMQLNASQLKESR